MKNKSTDYTTYFLSKTMEVQIIYEMFQSTESTVTLHFFEETQKMQNLYKISKLFLNIKISNCQPKKLIR